jgi:hypothetical protein
MDGRTVSVDAEAFDPQRKWRAKLNASLAAVPWAACHHLRRPCRCRCTIVPAATQAKGRTVISVVTINPDGTLSGNWYRRTDRGSKATETWKKGLVAALIRARITSLPCWRDHPCCPHWPRIC